jgi:ABC-2 type transport system permease protein
MRTLWSLAVGVLRLESKDRSNFFWMLLMPVAFIGMFGPMNRARDPEPVRLVVVDREQSFLSQSFLSFLEREDLGLRVVSSPDSVAAGARSLTLPAGFSDSLGTGRRTALAFRAGRDPEEDLNAQVAVYKAIARMLTVLAEMNASAPADTLAASSTGFQAAFREHASRPDRIVTQTRVAGRGRMLPTGAAASAQAMLVLFLLINTTASGAAHLAEEKQSRVLARHATLPISRGTLLSGRILGLLVLALVQAAIILVTGRLIYRIDWGNEPVALFVLLVALGLTCASLGLFLGALLRTPEQAGALAWIVPLFLGAIGGCWWPLEIVPHWMRVAGHLSPAAWAMDALHGLTSFGQGASAIVLPCTMLLLYAAALTAAGARLLRVSDR